MSAAQLPAAGEDRPEPALLRLDAGFRLEYVTRGPRSSPAVVFIHGWPDSWWSFAPVIASLPRQRRCVAVSLRGFGGSDAPGGSYRPVDFAGDVVELLDHLGVTSAIVVGHSLGSVVAQQIAVDQPELVVGLVLIGGFTRLSTAIEEEVWDAVSELEDPVDEAFVREFQTSTLASPIDPQFFERLVAESDRVSSRVWRAAFAGLRNDDHRRLPARIGAPTLLIWGDRDGLVPRAEQDRLLSAFQIARLEVYAGAGHSPNWERPQRVGRDIETWVRHVTGAGDGG